MKNTKTIRTYSELITLPTFEERYEYLKLDGVVGEETFGFDRYMNQAFYQSREWKRVRDYVILRDNGCDLGVDGYTIYGKVLIHHMNPITAKDIATVSDYLMNPEYLICVSHTTHNAIHYGDEDLIPKGPIIRTPNDTCPWRT
jgi:hypothetical protein